MAKKTFDSKLLLQCDSNTEQDVAIPHEGKKKMQYEYCFTSHKRCYRYRQTKVSRISVLAIFLFLLTCEEKQFSWLQGTLENRASRPLKASQVLACTNKMKFSKISSVGLHKQNDFSTALDKGKCWNARLRLPRITKIGPSATTSVYSVLPLTWIAVNIGVYTYKHNNKYSWKIINCFRTQFRSVHNPRHLLVKYKCLIQAPAIQKHYEISIKDPP